MKILHMAASLLLCGMLATGCSSSDQNAVAVGADQVGGENVSNGAYLDLTGNTEFRNYKTYAWASQVTDAENNTYFTNDADYKTHIKDAVEHELHARGYTYQAGNPDFMVNFRVFDQPTEIAGSANYGQGYWSSTEVRNLNARTAYKLDAGSLIVQMVDLKSGDLVWQGYASGLINNETRTMEKEQARIDEAVARVFDRYSYRAD